MNRRNFFEKLMAIGALGVVASVPSPIVAATSPLVPVVPIARRAGLTDAQIKAAKMIESYFEDKENSE